MIRRAIVLVDDALSAVAPHAVRVAGLTMLERNLAMLRWAGVEDVAVVVGPDDEGRAAGALQQSRNFTPGAMRVRFVVDHGLAHDGPSIGPAAREGRGPALVLRADTVYDKGILTAVASVRPPYGGALVATAAGEAIGMVVLDGRAVRAAAQAGGPFERFMARLATERSVATHDIGDRLFIHVHDAASAQTATDALWNSCRKPIDGIVARTLNRNISLFISRRIAHLPIHPNHVSGVTFLLGILAALSVAQGGYGYFLLGAALFKLNSILDGVDGELARVKFQMSVLGEWLDTLSDDISNLLFFVALTIGTYRMTGQEGWVTLGLLTVVPSMIASAYQYTLLLRGGRGDLLAIKWFFERGHGKGDGTGTALGRVLDSAKYLVKKDFFVFLTFVMALVGLLPNMLFLTAGANLVLLALVIVQEATAIRARRQGKTVDLVLPSAVPGPTPTRAPVPTLPGDGTRRPVTVTQR